MSLYDNASLVMIPSGVKEDKLFSIKPTDGSGDFTFSRGSDIQATRVNSSGLIEKAKENLLLQSNNFDTTWELDSGMTLTSGQSGYDGSSDAWLLERNVAFDYLRQDSTNSGVQTYSVYAKAGTLDWIFLRFQDTGGYNGKYFDLSNGVKGSTDGTIIDSNITSLSGGWYRCDVTINATLQKVWIYPVPNDNGVGDAGTGNIYIQDAQLNHGLIAQDYVETTTTAVVEGLTADLPRLDYSGGASCSSLLLEPSRTNKNLQSEYFNTWYTFSTQTATDNAALSPEGVQNAALLERTSSSGNSRLQTPIVSVSSGASVVHSIFLKAHTANNVIMYSPQGGEGKKFDISAGTAGDDFISAPDDYGIEPYADDWYRIWIVSTMPSTSAQCWVYIDESDTTGFYAYGFQTEEGSYPTSYIPTYGTAANRGKDSAITLSVPSLIGQTEGTWFVEYTRNSLVESSYMVLSNIAGTTSGSYQNGMYLFHLNNLGANFVCDGFISNAIQFGFIKSGGLSLGKHKIAIAYKQNDFALYIDGVQIGTDTSGNVPAMNFLTIGGGADVFGHRQSVNQALLFKTRLTNAELASLTTI